MKLSVKYANIFSYGQYDKGKLDKRYKSGYRIKPSFFIKNEIVLCVILPIPESLGVGMHLQNSKYGNFLVTVVNYIERTATLKMVSTANFLGNSFTVDMEIEVTPLRFMVKGEGN